MRLPYVRAEWRGREKPVPLAHAAVTLTPGQKRL